MSRMPRVCSESHTHAAFDRQGHLAAVALSLLLEQREETVHHRSGVRCWGPLWMETMRLPKERAVDAQARIARELLRLGFAGLSEAGDKATCPAAKWLLIESTVGGDVIATESTPTLRPESRRGS